MIKIAISGAAGRIGRTIYKSLIGSTEFEPVFGVDVGGADDLPYPVYKSFAASPLDADVVIDFSSPAALDDILAYAAEKKCRLVLATTGYTPEQEKRVEYAANEVPVFRASNMSLGVNLLGNLAKEAAKFLGEDYDIEIVETHHNRKLDSPSGTALTLANEINSVRDNSLVYTYGRHEVKHRREANEIGIHAVRGGTVVGKHEIMFLGTGEVITLMHESENKEVFVRGALRAAKFLMDKQSGLYDMTSIIAQNYAVTSVSTEKDVALVTLPRISFDGFLTLLDTIKRNDINLDMISHHFNADATVAVSFTLGDADVKKAEGLIPADIPSSTVRGAAKITTEGAGMQHRSGVAADVLTALRGAGAEVFAITTSETQISCCIDARSLPAAEAAVKKYYGIK